MISLMGNFLVGFAALIALYAAVAAWLGQAKRSAAWKKSADHAITTQTILLGAAVLFLGLSLVFNQFQLAYVYNHSSLSLPLYLKISAIWAGQEGSLLFWSFMQALFTFIAVSSQRGKNTGSVYIAAVILNLLTFFFTGVTFLVQNPFAVLSPMPADGLGLNPLLRHPGMAFHPPALYLGYVGLSVPFAFSLAALISGETRSWSQPIHRWGLFSWLGLGIGLLLGMRWAYDVLGWGGYWGWDAVENAALMPWLVSSALIHTHFFNDEKDHSFNGTFLLSTLAYLFVVFGTYVTRSGQIQSVHAYTKSGIGPVLLAGLLALLALACFVFIKYRQRANQSVQTGMTFRSAVSKLTTLILLTLTFSVFLGTVLPALSASITGRTWSVSTGWFDQVTGPQFALLVLLMGLCPLAARAIQGSARLRRLLYYFVGGLALAALFSLLLGAFQFLSFLTFTLIGFSITAELLKFLGDKKQSGSSASRKPILNQRRLSSWMIHTGLILLALGVFASKTYEISDFHAMQRGDTAATAGYQMEYKGIDQQLRADYVETKATLTLSKDGRFLAELSPYLNQYSDGEQSITIPAVRSLLAGDVYVVLTGWSDNGNQATFQVFINPLINFMWFGGILLLAGGYLALGPRSSKRAGRILYWVGGIVFVGLALWLMWGIPHGVAGQDSSSLSVGSIAPPIDGITDLQSNPVALNFADNNLTIVNFWAPWCPSCKEELPDLQTLWEEYEGQGVAMIGVTYDTDQATVQNAVQTYGLTYPIALDPEAEISMRYFVSGIPETYIIDANGRIIFSAIGSTSYEKLEQAIQDGLAQTSGGS